MKLKAFLLAPFFSFLICATSAQVTLQPLVQKFGTVPGTFLGLETKGIVPSQNFPFRGSISQIGGTGVYTFQNQNDTARQGLFLAYNMTTGDLNGDGWKDVVVSKRGGTGYVDSVLICWGTTTGIDTVAPTRLHGLLPQDGFGASMCIGNLIGDSTPDLVIGSPQYPPSPVIQGRVYIYRGGTPFDTIPAIVLNGDSARYTLGVVCVIGDLNNDGYNDLAVRGWFQLGTSSQRFDYVNVWFGSTSFDTTRDMQLRSSAELNSLGLACFDANGDGIADLLWTSRDSLLNDWVYVHFGGNNLNSIPNLKLRDPQLAEFGTSIVNGGDMNGDGYDDVVVGAYFSIVNGYVFVYGGGPRIDQYLDAGVGMSSDSYFGKTVSSVGDINGDGLSDIIVGAPNYEFGNHRGYWGIFKGDSSIRVTDVKEEADRPIVFQLYQSYPNPFNPKATIDYDLKQRAFVTLKVYNVLGQEIRTLVNSDQEAGQYSIEFDGKGLPSGTYFYEITVRAPDGTVTRETKKMLLLSAREKREENEYEDYLLTTGRAGNDAALKELARIRYERAGGRLKQFLIDPKDMGHNMMEGKLVQQFLPFK